MSWVNTFEAAKRDVFMQQNVPRRPEPEEPYSPMITDSTNPSFSFSREDLAGSQDGTSPKSNGDSEESKPLGSLGGWAASVPGVSLLLSSYAGAGTTQAKSNLATESRDAPEADVDQDKQAGDEEITTSGSETAKPDSKSALAVVTTLPTLMQQTKDGGPLPPVLDTETLPSSRSKSLSEVSSTVPEPTSGHSQQLSEIEKLMNSSLHLVPKATPLPVSE